MRRWFLLLLVLGFTGCATVPEPLRNAPEQSPSIDAVRADPQAHRGERVRWGGTIAGVENRAERTLIEVVGRPLNPGGRPDKDGTTPGRFLARVEGFLDPAVYKEGRLLTVVGRLDDATVRPVGDYPYRYPVVATDGYYLWPPVAPGHLPSLAAL